jgi:tetratricopeptide (TPR) repeat protein
MKIRLAFAILAMATVAAAQDRMAENLRKGVVEEESKHNLNAAIQDYQAALSQFDEARQTAATALFRIAECYRKLGKDDQAMAAYKRVAQEFADQTKLAEQSRNILTNSYHTSSGNASAGASAADIAQAKRAQEAREQYRNSLVESVRMAENELVRVQQVRERGVIPQDAVDNVKKELMAAQRNLYAFDAGIPQAAPATGK